MVERRGAQGAAGEGCKGGAGRFLKLTRCGVLCCAGGLTLGRRGLARRRAAEELKEAATHLERAATLHPVPEMSVEVSAAALLQKKRRFRFASSVAAGAV